MAYIRGDFVDKEPIEIQMTSTGSLLHSAPVSPSRNSLLGIEVNSNVWGSARPVVGPLRLSSRYNILRQWQIAPCNVFSECELRLTCARAGAHTHTQARTISPVLWPHSDRERPSRGAYSVLAKVSFARTGQAAAYLQPPSMGGLPAIVPPGTIVSASQMS